ncbi:MAG: LysR family transcriptional regulator [Pseudomonadota bacterium]
MDFELLEDFLSVLEHGSILAAAEASGTSQPTLSRRIRELEDSLGVLLLNRTSRGISPTVYGSMFKHHAEELLRKRHAALDEIRALKSGAHGHARIGLAPAFAGYLPVVMRHVRARKSGVTFEVVEGTYDALVQRTLKGDIDGAFTMLPPGESVELLAVRALADEPVVVVADPEHALFEHRALSLTHLADEQWIVINRPRSILDGFYQAIGEQGLESPCVAIETSSLEFLKSMVKGGTLLAAVPRGSVMAELEDGSLRVLDLGTMPRVKTGFVHRHGVMPPLVTEIVGEMKTVQIQSSDASV